MSRRLLIIILLLALVLVGLAGFYLFLTGGTATDEDAVAADETGLVHVRSIYTADGENMRRPVGVGADESGFVVTLRDSQLIVEFDSDGDFVRSFGERGMDPGQMLVPLGVDIDRLSDHIYVVDRSRLRLIAYNQEGDFLWEVPVLSPLNVTVTPDGVIVNTFGPLVLFDTEGQSLDEFGSRGPSEGQFDYPRASAPYGESIIVADTNNTRVQNVALSGEVTATANWVYGEPPRVQDDPDTVFGVPSGVAVDDEGRAFVLDGFRTEIAVLDAETGEPIHTYTDIEGDNDGQFYLPTGIAYLGGDSFAITDTYNDRVQIVRLLLPEDNTLLNRNPWLWWLLPLLLLPLLFFFFRKRSYATEELLERAVDADQARLFAAVYKRLHVLPSVYDRFADVMEDDVRLGDYLERLDVPEDGDAEDALAKAAARTVPQRLLLARHTVLCMDAAQGERFVERGISRVTTYDEVTAEYALGDASGTSVSEEPSAPESDSSSKADASSPDEGDV